MHFTNGGRRPGPVVILGMSLLTWIWICNHAYPQAEQDQVQQLVDETVRDAAIPGMLAAVIDSTGVRSIAAAGKRNIDHDQVLKPTDQIHLGSCTKAMTSALLAKLVEERRLAWDSDIQTALPGLSEKLAPEFRTVTLHQLLTHRSACPANADDWWEFSKAPLRIRRVRLIEKNLAAAPEFEPGSRFLYSNFGYLVAGCMAEHATGHSWETLMRKKIFAPLEMRSAGFGAPGKPNRFDQPWGHVWEESAWKPVQFDNAEALGPAGRVHCSIEDWAKFLALFLKPEQGNSLLNKESMSRLVTPEGSYAPGWGVAERPWGKGTVYNHAGSNNTWFCVVWLAPEIDRGFIVATNSCNESSANQIDQAVAKLISISTQNSDR